MNPVNDMSRAEIRAAIHIIRDCRECKFVTEDGNVRKIMGTLPITKDGVIAMPGIEVYHPKQDLHFHLVVMKHFDDTLPSDDFPLPDDCEYIAHYSYWEQETGYSQYETYDVRDCYSTKEAAEAAKGEIK